MRRRRLGWWRHRRRRSGRGWRGRWDAAGRRILRSPCCRRLLKDRDSFVMRAALEAALSSDLATLDELAAAVGMRSGFAGSIRADGGGAGDGADVEKRLLRGVEGGIEKGAAGGIGVAMAYSQRHPGYSAYAVDIARRFLDPSTPTGAKLEAARLMQIGLGDVGASGEGNRRRLRGIRVGSIFRSMRPNWSRRTRRSLRSFPTGEVGTGPGTWTDHRDDPAG